MYKHFVPLLYNKLASEPVAYADNFHGGVSFSGIGYSFVFAVRCL